jgi:hypothetical protein
MANDTENRSQERCMTNPFAAPAPQQPAEQQAPAGNPYAAPAAPPAQPPAGGNPFAPSVPQQPVAPPAQAPGNPYAQQGYAPPAQPAGYPPAAAPQQYAPQAQQAPAAAPPPPLGQVNNAPPPPPSGERGGAKFAHMYGRLVLLFPMSISERPKSPQYITQEDRAAGRLTQPTLTATVVVLDDGQGGNAPIRFGGDPAAFPPVPDTETAPLPYVRKAMWISQSKVIEQCRPFIPASPGVAPGMVCGRLLKAGPRQNDPWYIEAADAAGLERANQYLALVQAGTFPHPLAQ